MKLLSLPSLPKQKKPIQTKIKEIGTKINEIIQKQSHVSSSSLLEDVQTLEGVKSPINVVDLNSHENEEINPKLVTTQRPFIVKFNNAANKCEALDYDTYMKMGTYNQLIYSDSPSDIGITSDSLSDTEIASHGGKIKKSRKRKARKTQNKRKSSKKYINKRRVNSTYPQ